MLWFTVWTLLVLGALGGALLVGRRLWRSGRALLHELERTQEVAARLAQRTAELEEQARAAGVEIRPDLGGDVDELRRRLEVVRAAGRERRAARRARHRGTVGDAVARWYGTRPATPGRDRRDPAAPLDS